MMRVGLKKYRHYSLDQAHGDFKAGQKKRYTDHDNQLTYATKNVAQIIRWFIVISTNGTPAID